MAAMSRTSKHIIFWVLIYVFWTYMKSSGYPEWIWKFMRINIINLAIYMAAFYLLKHVQIPRLYSKGKYISFVGSILVTSVIFYVFWRWMGLLWIDEMRGINKDRTFASTVDYITQTVQFYSPALLLLVWENHEDHRKERERMQELEKEKLRTELKYLKAQLNPHFLFNTLNNLYSFVVMNSPKAPDMIMKLSAMLDYILYKSQVDKVALKEEVEAIENFVGLEQTRYGDRLQVESKMDGDLTTLVSPLILLSIVENAFKHGASGDIDAPKININIHSNGTGIHCSVKNTKSKYQGQKTDDYKKGIGLSNIKRQLELSYPGHHTIDILDGENEYHINITLSSEHE